MAFYATNGKAVKALDIDSVFGAGFETGLAAQASDPRLYYIIVPFVRRAVRLRANALAGVPVTLQRGETDISARPEFSALMGMLSALIWKTEFALCLSVYGAYWRRATNRAGMNPTPEWLLPNACWPYSTAEAGLQSIRYTRPWGVPGAGQVEMLPLDEVVYFWQPSLERAAWPGSAPGQTALAAGSALANRDQFVAGYFSRGAAKSTLLTIPSNTSDSERNKLKAWWNQVVAGVLNAWRASVISADVKPVIIGDSLKDTESDSLTLQYRQDIAAAFEVPESMLLSNSANYATASVERISFYEETVFPELDLILSAINRQWLEPDYGVSLVSHPEQTEARQDAQVQQAQAVTELVGQPVLTVNEGRAWLGMEPIEEQEKESDEDQDYQDMEAEEDAEEQQDEAKALAGEGKTLRAAERAALRGEHRAMREQTRERHRTERKVTREKQIGERGAAQDAGTRMRLVYRHRAEQGVITARQAAERKMLRMLHTAERGRLRDRHAVARAFEERVPA